MDLKQKIANLLSLALIGHYGETNKDELIKKLQEISLELKKK